MALLAPALDFTLPHEGGYSNNPADPGGETMYGITKATAMRHGYTGPMRELPLEVAAAIYEAEYWPGLESVANQAVASKIFDMRVNFGVTGGNKLAQLAVNRVVDPPTAVDGIWGPDTLASINAAIPADLLDALATEAANRYQAIVDNDPSKETFIRGWMRRALDLPALVVGGTGLALLLLVGAGIYFMTGRGRA